MRSKTNKTGVYMIAEGAVIAALYVALTMLSQALGLTSFAVQFRLSEPLCVLPYFTFSAVPGLTLGCVLANILLASAPWDIVMGSFATFLGALICRLISSYLKSMGRNKLAIWIFPIPNIITNTLILPPIIKWVYGDTMSLLLIALLVLAEEIVSCALGIPLAFALDKRMKHSFEN